MIPIRRTAKPGVLQREAAGWTAALLTATTKKQRDDREKKYRHQEVRQTLEAMFHGKCAYCEGKVTHVSYAHIEHYQPKSKRPDLTFEWDNLLLACGVCNGTGGKGDKFPEAVDNGPYINPCNEDPSDHFTFHYDMTAQLASVYGSTPRGATTELDMRLNRPDLREHRSTFCRKLLCIEAAARNGDTEARAIMDAAIHENAEYAAFARVIASAP